MENSSETIALSTRHPNSRIDDIDTSSLGLGLDESQAASIHEDNLPLEPPSRKYQLALLLAGFMMIFHVIGINTTFGTFQEFYSSSRTNIKDARGQDALVSLVGTIGSGLTWSGSIFVNPLIARVEKVKYVALTGAFIMSMGLALASFSTRLWHLYLTQAILYGLGASMYYFPIIAIAPMYFDRHRGFAMGLILAGSGVGGLTIAPVQQYLIPNEMSLDAIRHDPTPSEKSVKI